MVDELVSTYVWFRYAPKADIETLISVRYASNIKEEWPILMLVNGKVDHQLRFKDIFIEWHGYIEEERP